MLILTRRSTESLKIGDEITITILGVKGQQVRVGISAPKQIPVHREEIYRRILAESEGLKSVVPLQKTPSPRASVAPRARRRAAQGNFGDRRAHEEGFPPGPHDNA